MALFPRFFPLRLLNLSGTFLICHLSLNICLCLSCRVLEFYAHSFHRGRNTPVWGWSRAPNLLQKAEIPLLMHIKVKSSSLIAREGPRNPEATILGAIYFPLSTEVVSDGTSAWNAPWLRRAAVLCTCANMICSNVSRLNGRQITARCVKVTGKNDDGSTSAALCNISSRPESCKMIWSPHPCLHLDGYNGSLQCLVPTYEKCKLTSGWHQAGQ